jgi:hypothetical protein
MQTEEYLPSASPNNNEEAESFYVKYDLDRWEYLYQKDVTMKLKRDDEIKKRQQEYDEKIMQQCTFEPDISKSAKLDKYMNKSNGIKKGKKPSKSPKRTIPLSDANFLYQRNKKWKKDLDMKIDEMKEEKNISKNAECTFVPDVSPNRKGYLRGYKTLEKSINKKAIDKHLERMIITRLREEEKLHKENNSCGSGNRWKDKYTIPHPPNLSKSPVSRSVRNICRPQTEEIKRMIASTPSMDLLLKYQSKKSDYVKFSSKMTYGQAVNAIHNSILSLN